MKKENGFYLIIILTILIIRLILFLYPKHITIDRIILHHFWIGILLILASILFFRKNNNFRLIFIGMGLGYVIDEFGFLVLGGGDFPEYWSSNSIISVFILGIIFFAFRKQIYKYILLKKKR